MFESGVNMKRVLVVSDSHGNMGNLSEVIKRSKDIDMLIHLGDIQGEDELLRSMCNFPVEIVRGNCDFETNNKLYLTIELECHKIFATHGHAYGVEWGIERLSYAALEEGCDIAMYGHTHVPYIEIGDDVTILNPGSISYPRQPGRKPTFLIMEIDEEGQAHYAHGYYKEQFDELML